MKLLATETLKALPAVILPRLIGLFEKTTPDLISEIRTYTQQGNLAEMAKSAHKLKGSCVSLGAEKMADICKELQHKGEENNANGVAQQVEALAALYPLTLEAMQTL